jgi:hypothetical protein
MDAKVNLDRRKQARSAVTIGSASGYQQNIIDEP